MSSDLLVTSLGPCTHPSPLGLSNRLGDGIADYTAPDARILLDFSGRESERYFELAGPREQVFFRSEDVTVGIVSCGGLCPGINNIIRGLFMQAWHSYGIRRIMGFRYGFLGLTHASPLPPLELTPDLVESIHHDGGTILGSSRGNQEPAKMVDRLVELGVNVLFCIGGDGTMRGAEAIWDEVTRRGLRIAIVGVPKTIDNDVPFIERTFGFETAVAKATEAIHAAHVEARGAPNGLGLVKLMGRHSGFIAASAVLAAGDANLVLLPEVPFDIEGERGLVAFLRKRLAARGHAVVVVAEGAGQSYVTGDGKDKSGNVKLGDIGLYLRDRLRCDLADMDVSIKYIDPSYIIRAQAANPGDAIFCEQLAENAVHAAMMGRTGMVIGLWGNQPTHLPLRAATSARKLLALDGPLWRSVMECTGQPAVMVNG